MKNGTTIYIKDCYNATETRPCSPYAACSLHNDSKCGYLYSNADQVGFCEVKQPPLWPALLQIPTEENRGTKFPEIEPDAIPAADIYAESIGQHSAPWLFTGENLAETQSMMDSLWSRDASITEAAMTAYIEAQAAGDLDLASSTDRYSIASESDFVDAAGALSRGLYEFGLVMGTSAFTSVTMLMEAAFVATSDAAVRPTLYFAQRDCSKLAEEEKNTLTGIGEAITNLTGFRVSCASLPPFYLSYEDMNNQVYCGWLNSGCVLRNNSRRSVSIAEASQSSKPIQEFVGSLFDFRNTDPSHGIMNVSVWMNNTNVARDPGVPDIQRWSQPVNLAANAFLKSLAGPAASVRLAGVKDMPKGETRLSLEFSSLLGPLFMLWFVQIMLPINVYNIVYEKEHHLRIMMRMQGLNDSTYFVVQYIWMFSLYCLFMFIFVLTGYVIDLKLFSLTSIGIQIFFYLLWGHVLTAFSFFFASWQVEARPAVLLAVVYVIVTGLVANVVLVQFIERGPAIVSSMLQIIPAFGIFRVLYEFAQYAFLADRTGGQGLTWKSAMTHPDCGFFQVCFVMLVEWIVFIVLGWYLEQVSGTSTGIKRNFLFFLDKKRSAQCESPRATDDTPGLSLEKEKTGIELAPKQPWFQRLFPRLFSCKTDKRPSEAKDCTSSADLQENSGIDYYYGSNSQGIAAASPCMDVDTLVALARNSNGQDVDSHRNRNLFIKTKNSIVRKISSIKVFLDSPKPGYGKIAPEDEDEDGNREDVVLERQKVERLWQKWNIDRSKPLPCSILLHKLRKEYPSSSSIQAKAAVRGLSLAIQHSECFGLLGHNGAGKTTTIKMMEGFLDPTDGFILIEGLSVPKDIHFIYSMIGVCPQHDLLWNWLTGREHLLFYGRIKSLHGQELNRAVDSILGRLNLSDVGNRLVSSYSGGMRRRLSVAIALIGDPLVIFLDEPSTGLDPSSRRLLWQVIKEARKKSAVVLTTHSMEEAEALCDRLGIIVNGKLACVGDPKNLTARFGGYLSYTITTPPHQTVAAARMVEKMSPSARLVYALGGNQRFELPLTEIDVEKVFRRMEEVNLNRELDVLDWGVSNATLEEVFIKITRQFTSI